jgi:hypothetical protein
MIAAKRTRLMLVKRAVRGFTAWNNNGDDQGDDNASG